MRPITPQQLGLVFFGWGVFVAIFAIWGAPWLKAHFGTAPTLYANFALMAADIALLAVFANNKTVVIVAAIISGIFIGVNNTLVTTAVMSVSPVERPVASAAYGFVRFIGGGLAPFVASKLVVQFNVHVPFWIAAATVASAAILLTAVHRPLAVADLGEMVQPEFDNLDRVEREEEMQVGAGLGNVD
jgi:MFS family permease